MLREIWRQPIHWPGMAAFAAAWLLASPAQAGQDYKDTHWGVAFTIPDGWSQDKVSSSQAAVSISRLGKGFRENVNLQVFPVSFEDGKRMRTAEFMKQVEQGMKQKLHITAFQPPEKTKVAGQFAWKTHYEAEQKGTAFRGTQWFMTSPGRGWVITWTNVPGATHPKQVEELIQSLRFIPVEYKNPKEGFSLTIPSGWVQLTPNEKGPAVMIGLPTEGWLENINVNIARSATEIGREFEGIAFAQTVQRSSAEALSKREPPIAFDFKSPERSKVAGSFAWSWTYDVKGTPMHATQWIVPNGKLIYTIPWTHQSGKSHPEQAEETVKSFRFVNEPGK
jgi:hypothetical protein